MTASRISAFLLLALANLFWSGMMLAPFVALQAMLAPPRLPSAAEATAVVYMGIAASVLAFICWNRGVAVVGANAAGFTIHLLPAFATLLAILLLGETFQTFHAVGVATILAGVLLATLAAPEKKI